MCVQYRGGCSVPWGDILSTVGGYLEYHGGCSVPWGMFSTVGDIMSTVGVILSTVGDIQYRGGIMMHVGGYHDYRGGVQYHGGYHPLKFKYCGGIS